ncbi:Lar family restriction alleviation protein [Sphingopyxis sp. PET50]|uniref:Lar family restriction alleviation protein n=1 Tax=Sphingopyxis sp. PET50 TaxID=2976533 RepID=UPI0021B08656|nr:Lar family restriction alleviation protein [Sphingopyxis sp. PET50]
MSGDLKPCPFCGGAAAFKSGFTDGRDIGRVLCTGCQASAYQFVRPKADAIAAWNARAEISSLRGEAADELAALRERVAVLEEHIREQSEHCRVRIQDGIELGATVWRLALEDVARENAALLAHPRPSNLQKAQIAIGPKQEDGREG